MSSSSSDSSETEIRVVSKMKNNVSNTLNQLSNVTNINSNSILQKGIPNKSIQNILNKKVNSMKKTPGQRKYETISSSDSEDLSGPEKNKKPTKRRVPIPKTISQTKIKLVAAKKCESGSDSDNEIKFPTPKIIKQEEDLESYRPGVILTDTDDVRFPQPINIKQEPGFEINVSSQNNYSVSPKRKLKRKDSNGVQIANDTRKEKPPQCSSESNDDSGTSIRRIPSSSKLKTASTSSDPIPQEVTLDEQPLDPDDDDKLVEKIEATIEEKKSRINVLQNVTLNKPKTPQDQLAELLPNLERLNPKLDVDLSEADVYLALMPSSFDPYVLLNQESIYEDCKIKVGKKYNLRSTGIKPEPCISISNCNKLIQFKGNIVVSHYIKKQKMPSFDVEQKQPFDLPLNLKTRHPLFGSNFENVQLEDKIQQKLDKAKSKLSSRLKKSKKRKENKSNTLQEPESEEIIYNLLNNSKPFTVQAFEGKSQDKQSTNVGQVINSKSIRDGGTTLSKKRKRSYQMDSLEEMVPIEDHTGQAHKKQKKVDTKRELFTEHAEPPRNKKKPKGVEKNTKNTSYLDIPLKVDIKEALFTECETDAELLTKKKKRKSGDKNNSQSTNNVDCEGEETYKNGTHNKKKKVDIKTESFTEYETDTDLTNKKNKKNGTKKNNFKNTKHLDSQQDESDDNYKFQVLEPKKRKVHVKKELCTEYETDTEISGKKKKSITKGLKDIKMEIFTEYETEAETSSPKKKKKSNRSETVVDDTFEADVYGRDIESRIYTKNKSKKVKSELLMECQTDGENIDTEMDTYREGYTDRELNKVKKKKKKIPKLYNLKKEILTENETDAETAGNSIKTEPLTEFETDVESLYPLKKKRRNKNEQDRRRSLANSTLKTEFSKRPSFSPDLSCINDELSYNFKHNHEDMDVIESSLIDSVNIGSKQKFKMNKER